MKTGNLTTSSGIDIHHPSSPTVNKVRAKDACVHDWYRFVLSFPPHLVQDYFARFNLGPNKIVLDPFCGTGTTLVECKMQGIESIGIEQNPIAHFASQTKTNWDIDPDGLIDHANEIADMTLSLLKKDGIEDHAELPLFDAKQTIAENLKSLHFEISSLIPKNAISPLPLHKTLTLIETLDKYSNPDFEKHERLALVKALNNGISNLRFGPEIGLGKIREDAPVISIWLKNVNKIAGDIRKLCGASPVKTQTLLGDSRELNTLLRRESIDAVITSPPYPNEKDYTRSTRLESVLLGFIQNKTDIRKVKQGLLRSNTRTVYKGDMDDMLIRDFRRIHEIADEIESRRVQLGKTSGFERLYSRVTKLYFGGMLKHLSNLRCALKPGAQLAYVVGDQASYFRVLIPTGQLLAEIAASLGYEILGLDLFRKRLATATKDYLREEVLVLRWPGEVNGKGTK